MKNLPIKLLIFIGFLFLGNNLKADTTYVDLDTISNYQKLTFCKTDSVFIYNSVENPDTWRRPMGGYRDETDYIFLTPTTFTYFDGSNDVTENIETNGQWRFYYDEYEETIYFNVYWTSEISKSWTETEHSICGGKDTLYAGENDTNNYQEGLRYIWTKVGTTDTIADSYYPHDTSLIVSENGYYILKIISGCNTVVDTINMELITSNPPELGDDVYFCNEDVSYTIKTTEEYDSYHWSNESTESSLFVDTAGTYYVTVSNACISDAVDSITIYHYTYPILELGEDVYICEGSSTTLTTFDYTNEGEEKWYEIGYADVFSSSNTLTVSQEMQILVEAQIGLCPMMSDTISVHVIHPPSSINICMVTVDTATHKNLIVWEKPTSNHIKAFKIYREESTDEYFPIGEVAYSDLSQFIDTSSKPSVHADKYKIAVMDSCGNESPLSPYHQTMNLSKAQGSEDNEIVLFWNKYEDESGDFIPADYKIYRKEVGENWYLEDSVSGGLSSYNYNVKNVKIREHFIVAIDMPTCTPTRASGGPYYQSVSNIEDEGIVDNKISTIASDFDITLYPNPNTGQFIIGFSQLALGTIQIFDISGKTIVNEEFTHKTKWTNDNVLEKGMYLVKINVQEQGVQVMKMVVE